MKLRKVFACVTMCSMVLSLSGCGTSQATEMKENAEAAEATLNVFAAASMTETLTEIQEMYKEVAPNVTLVFNFDSSGTLKTQIQEGADCDVFISAGAKQMDALVEDGTINKDDVKTLLINDLVLVAAKGEKIDSLDDLKSDSITKIAIGDPESVPAGKYAKEVLDNTKLYDAVQSKLVLGKDVKQVLSYVQQGAAQVGFVYLSDAHGVDDVDVVLTTDEDTHSEIAYPIAVLKDSKQSDAAKQFEDFLLRDAGQAILEKYGFKKAK